MYIETIGQGPDLVLIHGWAMHGGIFASLTQHLRTNFRLHVVDLPGYGFNREDEVELNLDACADALIDKIPRAIWIGWSLGGLVPLTIALKYPNRLRGIVEIAAAPRFLEAPEWPWGISQSTFEQFGRGLHDNYRLVVERFIALEVLGSQNAQAELRELKARVFERGEPSLDALKHGMRILGNTDLRSSMSKLAVPNLWIAGRRDRLIQSGAMRWSSQQNPMGRFIELPSGHAPFISGAHEVANAITQFANSLAP